MKNLTNNLKTPENAADLIVDYLEHKQNHLYEAVLETLIRANRKLFEEVNSMSMKDLIMELFPEKVDQTFKEETKKAVNEAVNKAVNEAVKTTQKRLKKEVAKKVEAAKKEAKAARLTERISLIKKKCAKNKPLSVIAGELETEPEEILSLYNIICENPEKTADEIYTLVVG